MRHRRRRSRRRSYNARRSRMYNRRRHRRSRRRNPVSMNPRRRRGRRGRRRSYNRRRGRNPGIAARLGGLVSPGRMIGLAKTGSAIAVGMGLNSAAMALISSRLPMFSSGIPSYIGGMVAALGTGMIASKLPVVGRFSAPIVVGGAVNVMRKVLGEYVFPIFARWIPGFAGMGDYLTVGDAAGARSLGYMGDMSDYLTVGDAAGARSLGGLGDDSAYVGEELAAL